MDWLMHTRSFSFLRCASRGILISMLCIVAAIILCPAATLGAGFSFTPAVTLGEDYDNNIFLTKTGTVSDFITRVNPSITLSYEARDWNVSVNDTFQWWYYAKQKEGNYSNDGTLSSKLVVIRNLLYFDVTDTYSNVILNPRGPSTVTNLNVNRTDSNTLDATPFIKYQIDQATAATAAFTYSNIWYRSGDAFNRQQYKGVLTIEHRINPRLNTDLKAEYLADRPADDVPDDDQTAVGISATYMLGQKAEIIGAAGYRWIKFSEGPNLNSPVYDAVVVYHLPKEGEIRLSASQLFAFSVEQGVVRNIIQRLAVRWGKSPTMNVAVYHSKDNYVQIDQTDEAIGIAFGLAYAPDARKRFEVTGSYEKDTFLPQHEKREVFYASATAEYNLTRSATVSLTDYFTNSTGDVESDNYLDNVVSLRLRITL